jgi:hypothetical protein
MKQQILNLKKKLLIVEIGGELSTEFLAIMNEHGMAEILGKLTDITEEQFEKWVDSYEWEDTPDGCRYAYRDYKDGEETDDYWDMYPFDTAQESFFSYLESHGIYFESKMMEPTKEKWGYLNSKWTWDEGEFHYNNELKIYKELHEAWKLENCYIFEII